MLAYLKLKWGAIALCALNIGAWFSLLAFESERFERSLFITPILDIERLIKNMMGWAGVPESRWEKEGIIPTDFGQTLSWEYLSYVKAHKIGKQGNKIYILYPENDKLTEFDTAQGFAKRFNCELSIAKGGVHSLATGSFTQLAERSLLGKGRLIKKTCSLIFFIIKPPAFARGFL